MALIWPLLHEYFVVCLSAENGEADGGGWCRKAGKCSVGRRAGRRPPPVTQRPSFFACAVADVNSLVERGITGLMRICQRLLPYKEDTAETLLHRCGGGHGALSLADAAPPVPAPVLLPLSSGPCNMHALFF